MSPFNLAQLRHLYTQMIDGLVHDTAAAAYGLLAPAIVDEEKEHARRDKERSNKC